MSVLETLGELSFPKDIYPELSSDIAANSSLNYLREEIDLTMQTAFLSNEPIKDLALSRPAPSLAQHVMKNRPNWQATMATYGVSYNNRTVCDVLEFSGPECDSVLEDVRVMCSVNVKTGYDTDARNTIVTATNAPAMAALNTTTVNRVLVLGMDKNGADLKRIQMAMHIQNIKTSVVDVVDWMAQQNRILWPDLPGIRIRTVVSDMSLLASSLRDIEEEPRYDLILANHTFASFAHFDIRYILDILEYNRTRGYECDLVGVYWDSFEMLMSSVNSIDPITRHFSYDGETLINGVRYNQFTMLNTKYCDPVIDSHALRLQFIGLGYNVEQWHASRYIQKYEGFRPDIFKKVKVLGGLRVFVVKTYKQLSTFNIFPIDKQNVPIVNKMPEFCGVLNFSLTDMSMMASFPVKKNKGRHWIGRDSMYVGPDILVAEKLNGVHFQCLVVAGQGRFITGIGGFILNVPIGGAGIHYFEGEVVLGDGWENAGLTAYGHISWNKWIKEIVVFDGLVAGISPYASFIDRWSAIVHLFNMEPKIFRHLKLQHYYSHPTPEDLDRIWQTSGEGIVIQPACSPAGAFKDGLGSARYIKKKITYEKRDAQGIFEVDLSGNFVRRRPDRGIESTVAELTLIREYWTYEEFFLFYRVMRNMYDPAGWRYPVLRTVKEYLMALEGVHNGFSLDDIIEDIFKAYMSVYAGQLQIGSISNVGVLIKELDKKWRTNVTHGDFYRITGGNISACDILVEEIMSKTTISNHSCQKCLTIVHDSVEVAELIDSIDINNKLHDQGQPFYNDRRFYIVSISGLRDYLSIEKRTHPSTVIDHWFLLKGIKHKDGLNCKFTRPLGELMMLKKLYTGETVTESALESLELFNYEIQYYETVVTGKYANKFSKVHELITVNIVLDKNKARGGKRCWYRPVIYRQYLNSPAIRCLGDLLRYFSYKLDCTITAGIV